MTTQESLGRTKLFIARTMSGQTNGKKITLVNICDEELLGTVVKTERVEMPISRDYYGSEKVSEDEAISLVRTSSVISLAGTRIVSKVVEANLASERAVKKFGNVPFLMIYKF